MQIQVQCLIYRKYLIFFSCFYYYVRLKVVVALWVPSQFTLVIR